MRGFSKKDVLNLYRFIDWVIDLPRNLEQDFLTEIEAFEGAKKMPYITSAERIGIEKGREQGLTQGLERGLERGLEKGRKSLALNLSKVLRKRFGQLPQWAEKK